MKSAAATSQLALLAISSITLGGNLYADSTPVLRPNIVFLVADDLGWGDTAYNGHPIVKTPELDAMASEGVRLDRFYAAAPVCSPTRGSILTGRHSSRYGINWASDGSLPAGEVTLAEVLRDAGYRTGHFGKWHLGQLSRTLRQGRKNEVDPARYSPPWEHGFTTCFSTEGNVPTYNHYYYTNTTDQFDHIIKQDAETVGRTHRWAENYWLGPGTFLDEAPQGDDSRIIMDRVIDFVRESRNEPFFACVWFHTPHTPVAAGLAAREPYAGLSPDEQHWYGCITALDDQIGRLRQELRRLGMAENTLVVFCSDNGPSYTHKLGRAGPYRGWKASLLEGGIRVPAIVEWPRGFPGGRVIDVPLVTSDLFPTVVKLAGARVKHQPPLDGTDILPVLTGRTAVRNGPIFFQSPLKNANDPWARPDTYQAAVQTGEYKLLTLDSGESWQLYDLASDPYEQNDLSVSHPDLVATMSAELNRWSESCRQSSQGMDYK